MCVSFRKVGPVLCKLYTIVDEWNGLAGWWLRIFTKEKGPLEGGG